MMPERSFCAMVLPLTAMPFLLQAHAVLVLAHDVSAHRDLLALMEIDAVSDRAGFAA